MTSRSALPSTPADRLLADLADLADDALAEAFARAAARWPIDGIPGNPEGWLFTAAHRIVIGRLRAEALAGRTAPLLAVRDPHVVDHVGVPRDAAARSGDRR